MTGPERTLTTRFLTAIGTLLHRCLRLPFKTTRGPHREFRSDCFPVYGFCISWPSVFYFALKHESDQLPFICMSCSLLGRLHSVPNVHFSQFSCIFRFGSSSAFVCTYTPRVSCMQFICKELYPPFSTPANRGSVAQVSHGRVLRPQPQATTQRETLASLPRGTYFILSKFTVIEVVLLPCEFGIESEPESGNNYRHAHPLPPRSPRQSPR